MMSGQAGTTDPSVAAGTARSTVRCTAIRPCAVELPAGPGLAQSSCAGHCGAGITERVSTMPVLAIEFRETRYMSQPQATGLAEF